MRPVYWGLVLYFVGICSSVLLGLVYDIMFLEKYPYGGICNALGESYYVNVPPFYEALYNIARGIVISLPLAIAMEAYRYLKRRKGEV